MCANVDEGNILTTILASLVFIKISVTQIRDSKQWYVPYLIILKPIQPTYKAWVKKRSQKLRLHRMLNNGN